MKDIVKRIVDENGEKILLEKKKFISLFIDYAPEMKNERKFLDIALSENIGKFFVECPKENRKNAIEKSRKKLEIYMSQNGVNEILESFTYALGWGSPKAQKATVNSSTILQNRIEGNTANGSSINQDEGKSTSKKPKRDQSFYIKLVAGSILAGYCLLIIATIFLYHEPYGDTLATIMILAFFPVLFACGGSIMLIEKIFEKYYPKS